MVTSRGITVSPSDQDTRDSAAPLGPEWDEKISAYIGGRMSEADREAFEAVLLTQPEIAKVVYEKMGYGGVFHEALQALRIRHLEAHPRIAPGEVTARPPWWGRTRFRFAVAIAVTAIVLLVVMVSRLGDMQSRHLPTAGGPVRGLVGVSPVGMVGPHPTLFVWTREPAATQYQLEIFDDSPQIVFVTVTQDSALTVPLDDLAGRGFRSGRWRVVPLGSHGARLSPSEPVPIRIEP
jgi:hypothetical protein